MNTRLSKNIQIDENFMRDLFLDLKTDTNKKLSLEEEIEFKIDSASQKAKLKEIENYIPDSFDLKPFPLENNQIKETKIDNKEKSDEEQEEINSEATKCSFKDSLSLLDELDNDIKELRKKNKNAIEKEKKIHIIKDHQKNNKKTNVDIEKNEIFEGEDLEEEDGEGREISEEGDEIEDNDEENEEMDY